MNKGQTAEGLKNIVEAIHAIHLVSIIGHLKSTKRWIRIGRRWGNNHRVIVKIQSIPLGIRGSK